MAKKEDEILEETAENTIEKTSNPTETAENTAGTNTVNAEPSSEPKKTEEPHKETRKEKKAEKKASAVLEDLQKKYDELNSSYLRMAAEYDNFRKRSAKEQAGIHSEAVSYAVKALLPTLDNLERAVQQASQDEEYKKGVELILKQLIESFRSIQVTEIDLKPGDPFDPNVADAVMHIEDDNLGENEIAEVFQKGFRTGDKIIRHAIVKVAN